MNGRFYLLDGTIAVIAHYGTHIRPWTLTRGATDEEAKRL